MSTTRVRILNWEKYNPKRADVKKPSWYREENGSGQCRGLYGVPAAERYVFNVLKGLASKEQSEEIAFDADWFCAIEGGASFDRATLDSALRLLDGRVIEVLEHGTRTLRERAVDVTLRDGRTDVESIAALAFLPPPPSEIQTQDLTNRADTAVLDPVRFRELPPDEFKGCAEAAIERFRASVPAPPEPDDPPLIACPVRRQWLYDQGVTDAAVAVWLHEYGEAKVLCGLSEARSDWAGDPKEFFAPAPGKFQSKQARVTSKLRRYIANAKPPPGGAAVIPLSERKAETAEEAIARAAREMTEKRAREDAKDRALPAPEERLAILEKLRRTK